MIYKVKVNLDSSIDCLKARLVPKGYATKVWGKWSNTQLQANLSEAIEEAPKESTSSSTQGATSTEILSS